MQSPAIISKMNDELFVQIMGTSPRKVREILFSQFGIKATKKKIDILSVKTREERVQRLHKKLSDAKTKQEQDVCTELIRNWLFTKREMLCSALDFLGVEHDNGLVEKETNFFKELSKEQVSELVLHLKKSFPSLEVETYLRFVDVPHLDV